MSERFDLVVIGSGPAGEKAAAQAAYFGRSVCVVERARDPGGAAVHTGTLPSKTLRETALYLSGHRSRELYGVTVAFNDPHAAVPKLIARKDAIARAESARIRENLSRHDVTYVEGHARFSDPHTVVVADARGDARTVVGDVILVATGSRPLRPAEIPFDHSEVVDSDEVLEIERLPSSLTVLGGGVIGCEYACMFAALGVEVTLVDARPEILTFLDAEMIAALKSAMTHLGIRLVQGARWTDVARRGPLDVRTALVDGTTIASEMVLYAAGRTGNTSDLALERAGLAANARGHLEVNARYQTAVPHIYACGDVIGFPALASTSMEQGRVAMCHAFDLRYKTAVSPLLPYGIYTIPEVSAVGETESSAKERGLDVVVGRARYAENARGQIAGDVEGLTKLVVERGSRRVVGCHVIGERATELVHLGQLAMQLGGTVDVFIDMVFNYPTLSEAFKYAAYDALRALAAPSS